MPAPRHICTKDISAKSKFTTFSSGAISNNITRFHNIPYIHTWTLMDTRATVATFEVFQFVDIVTHLTESMLTFFNMKCLSSTNQNLFRINTGNYTPSMCDDHSIRITCSAMFHTGADPGCLWTDQRYCLSLVVSTHQCPVRVFMF